MQLRYGFGAASPKLSSHTAASAQLRPNFIQTISPQRSFGASSVQFRPGPLENVCRSGASETCEKRLQVCRDAGTFENHAASIAEALLKNAFTKAHPGKRDRERDGLQCQVLSGTEGHEDVGFPGAGTRDCMSMFGIESETGWALGAKVVGAAGAQMCWRKTWQNSGSSRR